MCNDKPEFPRPFGPDNSEPNVGASGAESCPKFLGCNANICPVDPKHLNRTHIQGEAICAYLREAAKNDRRLPSA